MNVLSKIQPLLENYQIQKKSIMFLEKSYILTSVAHLKKYVQSHRGTSHIYQIRLDSFLPSFPLTRGFFGMGYCFYFVFVLS